MKSFYKRLCIIFLCIFLFFTTFSFNNKYYDKVCYAATGEGGSVYFIDMLVVEILESLGIIGGSAGVAKTILGDNIRDELNEERDEMLSSEYLHETTAGITFDFNKYLTDHPDSFLGSDMADWLKSKYSEPIKINKSIEPITLSVGTPYNLEYDWDFTAQGDDIIGSFTLDKSQYSNACNITVYYTVWRPDGSEVKYWNMTENNCLGYSFVRKAQSKSAEGELYDLEVNFYFYGGKYYSFNGEVSSFRIDRILINDGKGHVIDHIGDDCLNIPEKNESVCLDMNKVVDVNSISSDGVLDFNSATFSNTFDRDLLAFDGSTTWDEAIGDLTGVNTKDWAKDYTQDKVNDKTWDDIKDKVKEKTREIEKEGEKVKELDNDMTLPNSIGLDFGPLMESVGTKFPFCIPWDFVNLVRNLEKERKAPEWDIKWQPYNHADSDNTDIGKFEYLVSFKHFDTIATILRYFILIVFVYTLISKTNKYIGRG